MARNVSTFGLAAVLAAVSGCAPAVSGHSASEATRSEPIGPIDYSIWVSVTPEPFRVPAGAYTLCISPGFTENLAKSLSPHDVPAIKVYANPAAEKHLGADRTGSLPVGATVVKEKWRNEKDKLPAGYAAMVKREKGYDPDHGDWEYVYVNLSDELKVSRGRIESCIKCHSGAAEKDYLFRTYLDVPAK